MERVISFIRLLNLSDKSTVDRTIEKICLLENIETSELVKELVFHIGTIDLIGEFIEQQRVKHVLPTRKSMTEIIDALYLAAIRAGGSYRVRCRACSGWHEILKYLVSKGYNDLHDLVNLLDSTLITTNDGRLLPCYSLKDAMNLVSSYTINDYEIVLARWSEGTFKDIEMFGSGNPQIAKATYLLLDDGVVKKVKYGRTGQIGVTQKYFYLDPPWKWADIPFRSIGWRMGDGEDYLDNWFDFWNEIDEKRAKVYYRLIKPPQLWKKWFLERMKEKIESHNKTLE